MAGPRKSDRTRAADRAGRALRFVLTDLVSEPGFDASDCQRVSELIVSVENLAARLYEDDINFWAEEQVDAEEASA